MELALQAFGIVLFALLIVASIALHEVGHLVPAKRFGVRVTEYMIGFGPTLWKRRRGETDYGVKAVPLGGYIRMIGMIAPPKGAAEGTAVSGTTGRLATLIEDARRDSLEEITPADRDRVFYRLPVRKRIIIMLGGPVMNLLLAFVLFAIVLVGIGLPQPTLQVSQVVPCTPSLSNPTGAATAAGDCPSGTQPSPAATAGLGRGETILALDGRPAQSWDSLTAWIRDHGGSVAVLTVSSGDATRDVPVAIATVTRPEYDESGKATGSSVTTGFLGLRPESDYVAQPWTSVPEQMWGMTTASVAALASLPVRLWELLTQTLIGGGERAIDGPVSVVGVSRLGGEIAASDSSVEAKAATFLSLAASLNLFLFLFNLIPILPLDGGHVAGAAFEGVRRRLARWRGRPDPGPVDIARLLPVTYAVAAVLLGMSVIVIWADIVRPITLG